MGRRPPVADSPTPGTAALARAGIGASDQHFVLSSLPPSAVQKRLALAIVCALLVVYLVITFGPFAGVVLGRVDAFIPIYTTAVLVNDSMTAILLYAQFSILRQRSTLLIASGRRI